MSSKSKFTPPFKLTRRVTSWMSTGANRLDRSPLCTHRKLISHMSMSLPSNIRGSTSSVGK